MRHSESEEFSRPIRLLGYAVLAFLFIARLIVRGRRDSNGEPLVVEANSVELPTSEPDPVTYAVVGGLKQRWIDFAVVLIATAFMSAYIIAMLVTAISFQNLELVAGRLTALLEAPLAPVGFDPFTALATVAAIVLAVIFSGANVRWPEPSDHLSLADKERLISSVRNRRILIGISFVMSGCSWLVLVKTFVSFTESLDPYGVLLGGCSAALLILSANFITTYREDLELAQLLDLEAARKELPTLIEIKQGGKGPGLRRFWLSCIPLLALASLEGYLSWRMSAGSLLATMLAELYLVVSPVIFVRYFVVNVAVLIKSGAGRFGRLIRAIACLGVVVINAQLIYLLSAAVGSWQIRLGWIGLLVVLWILPTAISSKRLLRRSRYRYAVRRVAQIEQLERESVQTTS